MYFYIYDDFVSTPKLQVKLSEIEAKLALLEIKGPVSRLHTLTSIKEVVKRAVLRGATTIIVVGDDRTLLKMLNALPSKKIVIGLIVVGPQTTLAKKLNIETTKAGIEAAAGRKLINVNTGKVNKKAFLQKIVITAGPFTAILDDTLTIKAQHSQSTITINNPQLAFSPDNKSFLEAHLSPNKGSWLLGKIRKEEISKLNFKKMILKSQRPMQVRIDDTEMFSDKTITIEVIQNTAKLIVGRERPRDTEDD